jgi:hypothetical protein
VLESPLAGRTAQLSFVSGQSSSQSAVFLGATRDRA